MPISFGIYTRPDNKGFGVYIKALSGTALEYFQTQTNYFAEIPADSLSRGGTTVATVSERLKGTETLEAAKAWIIRFKHLDELSQIERIGAKWVKPRPSHCVWAKVRYYKILAHGRQVFTSYMLKDIADMCKLYSDYQLVESVCRNVLFSREYYDKLVTANLIEVVPETLKGAYAGFTAPTITKIKKRKMAGQDRHAGYRVVGSNKFWRNK